MRRGAPASSDLHRTPCPGTPRPARKPASPGGSPCTHGLPSGYGSRPPRPGELRSSGPRTSFSLGDPLPSTDFLVIGTGVAGMWFALEACRHGKVTMITKTRPLESNSAYAQGGIASVWS
ncbi:MAG: FAD-binding protein, partial [Myxococcales bacterium]|nr:FAD-binding protein [Myxococcales bacterium]